MHMERTVAAKVRVFSTGRGREGKGVQYCETKATDSPGQMHLEGNVVVQVREGDAVLSAHRLPDDDLVDVVELIPVLIPESQMHSTLSKKSLARHTPLQNALTKTKNNLQHKSNILFTNNFACSFLFTRQKRIKVDICCGYRD